MGWTGNRGWRRAAPAFLPAPEGRLEVERVTVDDEGDPAEHAGDK